MSSSSLQTLHEAQEENALLKAELEKLRGQVNWFKKQLFGSRSERRCVSPEDDGSQMNLFGQPEATEKEIVEETSEAKNPLKKKKRRKSRKLAEDLPREEVLHDLTNEEKVCSCCGREKHRIGEDVTEELEIIPAKVFVRRHVRPKYACRDCKNSVEQAPLPERPIKRCLAGPGLLAYLMLSKYGDHIPLCRMERIFARAGIEMTRSNMSQWMMELHHLLAPLIKLMRKKILSSYVINSDDTTIRVQQKGKTKRCYLWVYLGDENAPYTVYDFRDSRSREGPNEVLVDYRGYLQADAYTGYEELFLVRANETEPRVLEVACWAHTRRYFVAAEESGNELATEALNYIAELYSIERQAKDHKLKTDERLKLRQKHSVPVLNKIRDWMNERLDALPESPLGKAIAYAENNWTALNRYAHDGRLSIDNNAAERAMRPVAVGRKNWLFAGSDRGGHAAATFFTLIESAKRAGINPYDYLHDLLTRIAAHPMNRLEELLPDKWPPTETSAQ